MDRKRMSILHSELPVDGVKYVARPLRKVSASPLSAERTLLAFTFNLVCKPLNDFKVLLASA